MKKTYFGSDWHLDHKNVIRFDGRPFEHIEDMNQTIIKNHNNIVNDKDDFYFLGDFSFNNRRTEYFLSHLKGNLFFIKGNHDKRDTIKSYEKYGTYLGEQSKIVIDKQDIVLNHFAMRVWERSHYGSYLLYGHSHGGLEKEPYGLSMDVGIMLNDYKPFSWEQIKEIMEKRKPKIIDHHKPR